MMKRSVRFIAFSLTAIMLFCMIPVVSMAVNVSDLKIVCFGDSLTHYGDYMGGTDEFGHELYKNTYPDHLATKTGATVVNAGVGGETASAARGRLYTEVLAENPDVVVICLGMNDQSYHVATGDSLSSVEVYRNNLEFFVQEITAAGADVVFLTPNPVCTAAGYYTVGITNYSSNNINKYLNAMREVALEYGCTLVDANYEYSAIDLPSHMARNDGVHQNNTGRQYFATLVAEHLAAVYEGTNKATMTVICKDSDGNELGTFTMTGAAGAMVTVASPEFGGYTAVTADVKTTFVDGAVHTFTYNCDLADAVEAAKAIDTADYEESVVARINNFVSEGEALLADAEKDYDAMDKCQVNLENCLDSVTTKEVVLSYGASYTATDPNYFLWDSVNNCNSDTVHPTYANDGIRLTDGLKGYSRGEDGRYAAWTTNYEVVIDLGAVETANTFRGYFAYEEWGVSLPKGIQVSYKVNETDEWSAVAGTLETKDLYIDEAKADHAWSRSIYYYQLAAPIEARYVKFDVIINGYFAWADEFEVAYVFGEAAEKPPVVNSVVSTGATFVPSSTDHWQNDWTETSDAGEIVLSDGDKESIHLYESDYVAYQNLPGSISFTVDLGEEYDISKVQLYTITYEPWSVLAPTAIVVWVSDDNGVTWTSLNTTLSKTEEDVTNGWGDACTFTETVAAVNGDPVKASLIKIDVSLASGFFFVNEIEVYGSTVGSEENPNPNPNPNPDPEPVAKGLRGDVNENGSIDARDYVTLKRAYFGTAELGEVATLLADVNNSGALDARDYVMLKRAYFKTYEIPEDIKYVY